MYVQLSDAIKDRGPKDVWACIAESTAPRPSRGTDYVQNMYITDPSLVADDGEELTPEQERLREGIEVLVFCSEISLFPKVAKPGDLIRFHRVHVNIFRGRTQLIAKIGRGGACQYCLFDNSPGGAIEPYQKSSTNYTFTSLDRELLQDLREMSAENADQSGKGKYLVQINELEPMAFVDLVCKVIAVEGAGTKYQVLYVWDGTDAKAYTHRTDWLISRSEDPAPSTSGGNIDEDDYHLYRRLPNLGGALDDNPPPLIGSIIPVNLYKPILTGSTSPGSKKFTGPKALPELPTAGSWVKLKNIQIVAIEGQLQALYLASSKWTPWMKDNQILELYKHRLKEKQVIEHVLEDRMLRASWISSDKEKVPFTTLRQILLEEDSGERQAYRCLVHLVNYLPKSSTEFCRRRQNDGFEFCLKLHLQDATADLDAMLLGEHGQAFFRHCPQQDMSKVPQDANTLQRLMNGLSSEPVQGIREVGQWFECGIERLYPDPGNSQENVTARYRVIDTVLQRLDLMLEDEVMMAALQEVRDLIQDD